MSGRAGVGKSALLTSFSDWRTPGIRRFDADLAGSADGSPLLDAVARRLGMGRPGAVAADGIAAVAAAIGDRSALIVVDHADACGVDVCYEIHPGEDLHDGITYEMFLERTGNHARACMLYDPSHYVLQCLDYLDNIDIYKDRIRMFHVKDAEFNPTGRQGVYGGYQGWVNRAGRFRSLGDGQVDFGAVFSKMAANDFAGWAVVEWECALKHPEDGAREGAEFVKAHIIRVTEKAFDDFADAGTDEAANRRMLGL